MAVDKIVLYINGLRKMACVCDLKDNKNICSLTNKRCHHTLENEIFNGGCLSQIFSNYNFDEVIRSNDFDELICSSKSKFDKFKFYKNLNNNKSYYWVKHEDIEVRYYNYQRKGELRIMFNIPKLLTGTNLTSIYQFNIQQIFDGLSNKLKGCLDLSKVIHLRNWRVSFSEINMDIILDKDKIDAVFNVLEKTKVTTKYKRGKIYGDKDGGKTLYFIPKNKKELNGKNDIVIKFYYKISEMKAHSENFNLETIYNNDDIVNLNPSQNILRIEISLNRDKIYNHFKPIGINLKTYKHPIGTFDDVMNFGYQCKLLNEILAEFGLNKTITTKETLKSLFKGNKELSDKDKVNYWNVVKLENKASHKRKPKDSVVKNCKAFIESNGYNILYADVEVEALNLEDIINSLPKKQQKEIATYKQSSIYKDLMFYKSTPPLKRMN